MSDIEVCPFSSHDSPHAIFLILLMPRMLAVIRALCVLGMATSLRLGPAKAFRGMLRLGKCFPR